MEHRDYHQEYLDEQISYHAEERLLFVGTSNLETVAKMMHYVTKIISGCLGFFLPNRFLIL